LAPPIKPFFFSVLTTIAQKLIPFITESNQFHSGIKFSIGIQELPCKECLAHQH
jgi:hypothetical protein